MKKFLVCFIVFGFLQVSGQATKRDYYLHTMADTLREPAYSPYIHFWIDFLYTEDDAIRKTYWNPEEVMQYGEDYALFYNSLFQYPVGALLAYFKPYILSVYFEDDLCHIVTAFHNFKFTPSDSLPQQNSNPFAILEIGIIKKDNQLYLTNLIEKRTTTWQKIVRNKISYTIDPAIAVDEQAIAAASRFSDSLATLFSIDYKPIHYVVCKSPQSLGYLLGFNFFFSGYTAGKAFTNANIVLSGSAATFNYLHELTHLILDPVINPGKFFSEGLAVFFGGSMEQNYQQCCKELKQAYPSLSEKDFIAITQYPNSHNSYTLAAMIVNIIYKEYGITGLKKLSGSPDKADEIFIFLKEKFGISTKVLFKKLNEVLAVY